MTRHEYVDDSSIADSASLWRRIPPWHFVYDANLQRWRPSSAAFENDPDGKPMSVILGDLVLAAGRELEAVLIGHEGYALAMITAGLARAGGQGVVRDPTTEEPAHALVFGPKPKSLQRRLAKESVWVLPPPG
jgi:hypothetical protein